MSAERYEIPHSYSPEAEAAMIAITARLRPIAESTTARLVEVTYWRDGTDMPLTKVVFDTHTVSRWRREAPSLATHLTIEEHDSRGRPPWRFDVPEVPAHVTAMRDVCDTVWVRQLIDGVDLWLAWLGGEAVYETRQSLGYLASPATLPLVECPDPRAAS